MRIFLILIMLLESQGFAGPNSISDPVCVEFSKTFLKRGDWTDTSPGARLWSLEKIYQAMRDDGLSPRDKSGQSCADITWIQAQADAQEYWLRRGEKEGCLVNGAPVEQINENCTERERQSIKDNLGYIGSLAKTKVLSAVDCRCGVSRSGPRALAQDVANIVSKIPQTDPKALNDHFKLTSDVVALINAPADICSQIEDKSLLPDPKNPTPPGEIKLELSCLKGQGEGILSDLKGNIAGLVSLVMAAKGVVAGDKEYYALKAALLGTVGPILLEYQLSPALALQRLSSLLIPVGAALAAQATKSIAEFGCYKPEVKSELVCKAIGAMSTEVALTVLGVGILTKGAKLAEASALSEKATQALVKARDAMGLAGAKVIKGAQSFANLRRVTEALKDAKWLEDGQNAVQVAVQNGKVFVKKAGEFFEVTNDALKQKITEQVAAFNEKKASLIEAFKAKQTQYADAIKVKIDNVVAGNAARDARQAAAAARQAAVDNYIAATDSSYMGQKGLNQKHIFVRDPADLIKDGNYIKNAVESIDQFNQYWQGTSRVTSENLQTATKEMHKISGLGKTGDRPYGGAANNPNINYGEFRPLGTFVNRRPSDIYAVQIAEKYKLGSIIENGTVPLKGIPEDALPKNIYRQHMYPDANNLHFYFEQGAEVLNELRAVPRGSKKALNLIADYYQIMANARPFDNINNSLVMNQANYLLKQKGFEAMSQGYLDYLAQRLTPDQFRKVFAIHNKSGLPLPPPELKKALP